MVRIVGDSKTCKICNATKDIDEFVVNTMKCKQCNKELKRSYYLANRGQPTEQSRAIRKERQLQLQSLAKEQKENRDQLKAIKRQEREINIQYGLLIKKKKELTQKVPS